MNFQQHNNNHDTTKNHHKITNSWLFHDYYHAIENSLWWKVLGLLVQVAQKEKYWCAEPGLTLSSVNFLPYSLFIKINDFIISLYILLLGYFLFFNIVI